MLVQACDNRVGWGNHSNRRADIYDILGMPNIYSDREPAMKLTKRISARKKTVQFNWCRKNWMEMNQKVRHIRAKSRDPMDVCFWCKHPFIDGEMMALAQPKGKNKVLCQKCADELLESGDKNEE